jgi:hypothetical protein
MYIIILIQHIYSEALSISIVNKDTLDFVKDEDQVQRRKVLARNVKVTGPTVKIHWGILDTLYQFN